MNTRYIPLLLLATLFLLGNCSEKTSVQQSTSTAIDTAAFHVQETAAYIDRGEKLALLACGLCHTGKGGKLTGKQQEDIPKMVGKVYSHNITNDPQYGIGTWTSGQLALFMRTGIKPDGEEISLAMPRFPNLSDEDLKALICFLTSDRYSVQAEAVETPKPKFTLLGKLALAMFAEEYTYPDKPIPGPDTADLVAVGEYLVDDVLFCYSCHSTNLGKVDMLNPQHTKGYLGGGSKMWGRNGERVLSANLTFDPETGIGNYSPEEFRQAMRIGRKKDGNPVKFPMQPFPSLTDQEARAIYTYLATVPVIKNKKLLKAKKS